MWCQVQVGKLIQNAMRDISQSKMSYRWNLFTIMTQLPLQVSLNTLIQCLCFFLKQTNSLPAVATGTQGRNKGSLQLSFPRQLLDGASDVAHQHRSSPSLYHDAMYFWVCFACTYSLGSSGVPSFMKHFTIS